MTPSLLHFLQGVPIGLIIPMILSKAMKTKNQSNCRFTRLRRLRRIKQGAKEKKAEAINKKSFVNRGLLRKKKDHC